MGVYIHILYSIDIFVCYLRRRMHTQISSRCCVLEYNWPTWKSSLLKHMFVCVINLGNKLKFQAKPWGIMDLQPLIV
jgi:hypothetical protein